MNEAEFKTGRRRRDRDRDTIGGAAYARARARGGLLTIVDEAGGLDRDRRRLDLDGLDLGTVIQTDRVRRWSR